MSIPYTYLIGWSNHNLWYYGVSYSKSCTPEDLWVKYYTSSKKVAIYRSTLGEPDIKQIRKTFKTPKSAKMWEDRVLARLNVRDNPKWINRTNNYSFAATDTSWNAGLTKHTDSRLQKISEKISNKRKSNPWITGKYSRSENQNIQNRIAQILNNNPNFKFKTYSEFSEFCTNEFSLGKSISTISNQLGIDISTAKLAIKYKTGEEPFIDQSWTKLKKNNPNLPFCDYKAMCNYIHEEITIKGRKKWHLHKELNVSYDAISRAIRFSITNHC